MYFIKHHMVLPIVDDKQNYYILINTLNGSVDEIEENEMKLVNKWKCGDYSLLTTEYERSLYEKLKSKSYIVDSKHDEEEKYSKIISLCKDRHTALVHKPSISFVLTYACNFACPYCFEKGREMNDLLITREMVDKVFEIHGGGLESICLYGGEPLLLGNREIIEYIVTKAPDAKYSIITNGFFLEEYLPLLERLDVGSVQVTLDGCGATHDKTRHLRNGLGTYDKIMAGIKKCLDKHINIKIRMNITSSNIDHCIEHREKLINDFSNHWSESTLSFELQPVFQASQSEKKSLEALLLEQTLSEVQRPIDYQRNTIINTALPILGLFLSDKALKPMYCHCAAESYARYYDSMGDIYSCIIAVGDSSAAVGRYYPRYSLNKESMLTRNIETIPECSNCNLALLCGGGCAYSALCEKGNVMRPNCYEIGKALSRDIQKVLKSRNIHS